MDALDDAGYSGSVLSLIENGEAFIKRNARMMWRKTLNLREKLPEYVERSCHEAEINYCQRNRLSGSFFSSRSPHPQTRKIAIISSRGMCVRENTSQAISSEIPALRAGILRAAACKPFVGKNRRDFRQASLRTPAVPAA